MIRLLFTVTKARGHYMHLCEWRLHWCGYVWRIATDIQGQLSLPSLRGRKMSTSFSWEAKAGMVHSVSGWTQGVQVKLWDPLRMHAIPECLTGVITTRCYTNPRLPLPYLTSLLRLRSISWFPLTAEGRQVVLALIGCTWCNRNLYYWGWPQKQRQSMISQCWGQVKSAHCTSLLNVCKVCVCMGDVLQLLLQ